MILKPLMKSRYIHQLEALDRRVSEHHPQKTRIENKLKNKLTGFRGEQALTFPLNLLPEPDYAIIHNPRLEDSNGNCFEIDVLLLTKYYILLLESKNWYGTLLFDEDKQVIRIGDTGIEEGLPNPVPQVKLQRYRLKKWLSQYNLPQIPILYFVVISFPSTIIKPMYQHRPIPEEVIHSNLLYHHIQRLNNQYKTPVVDKKGMNSLGEFIVQKHTEPDINVLKKFGVEKSELIRGVFCPSCESGPMTLNLGIWHCSLCNHYSKNAHLAALADHKLLIGDKITNREARDFLMVKSPDKTKRLLTRGDYRFIGNRSRRTYIL
ncbi:nuclease-related domain-containing protein [Virgibacillus siamensis]|uniref:nuclease-related domain-containing protein n=1 Tax=Virgibacillus siamensis TaxID=480071 RepID=UPI00098559C7|nr:nuclease-related domain-containing protein [Virgibacillus siamensis]